MRRPLAANPGPWRGSAGFTLVEVLVALLVMALLAGLAWRGIDGIVRARDASRESMDRILRLSTVLTQWEQDLRALHDTEAVPALAFDGQTLRLTRRAEDGVTLVAWSVRGGQWLRWARPGHTKADELQQSWLASQQLLGNEPGHLKLVQGAERWQVFFNRDGQWSNAQSTGNLVTRVGPAPALGAAPPPPAPAASPAGAGAPPPPAAPAASAPATAQLQLREALPEAVRLQIVIDGQTLTRDIALGPAGS